MNKMIQKAVLAGLMTVASQQAAAINIQFDYSFDSNNFFNSQAKKDVMSAAGSYFSNIIQDDLTAINSSVINHLDVSFSNPGTGSTTTLTNYSVAADTIVVYVGGRALGGSTLGVGGYGGFSVSGLSSFVDNAVTRGEAPNQSDVQGPTAYEFAPWGGSIAFNTASSWYFDSDISTDGDVVDNDFYSVALHELGHVLGLGTADSWANLVSGGFFTGSASSAVYGGNVPLHSDFAHWENGTNGLVDGVTQEAAMDPTIITGTRKVFTDLDNAALTDVGWEVSAVPVPAAVWLFGSGLLGLVAVARRRA